MVSTEVILRQVTFDDSELLRRWRNDDATIRNSISQNKVQPDEHRVWLRRVISDPNIRLYIGEVDGQSVGNIRLELSDDYAEIAVTVDAKLRKRGIGTQLIRSGCASTEKPKVIAHIRPDNQYSIRAFENAGFHYVRNVNICGVELRRLEYFTDIGRPRH